MNLTSPSQVKAWCIENGFHPNRTLGQNFLIDRNVVEGIVRDAGVESGQHILEVGPGLGVLTQVMLERGARVTAVEKDRRLAERLHYSLGEPDGLVVLAADALELDLDNLLAQGFDGCVSNLPYSVGTRILIDYARHWLAPRCFTVMVQSEVAERLVAGPGGEARGLAGVWLQLDYDIAVCRSVKATCFWPRPEVGSSVVRLERIECSLSLEERNSYYRLTQLGFQQRRKQLGGVLRREFEGIEGVGLDLQRRAAELSNLEWQRLARAAAKMLPESGEL